MCDYFLLDALAATGMEPPRRLYFRGSVKVLATESLKSLVLVNTHRNTENILAIPLRLMRTLSLVPFPPSQNPLPALPTSTEWQTPQSSGR